MKYEPLPEPKLRWWMGGPELKKLARAARRFFAKIGEACIWPARQMDPLSASMPILNLLAWQRGVKRYPGEPERLFRLRVAYAYQNAKDAGQVNGWKRIFQRLELGPVELEERMAGQDWDIVGIVVDDSTFPDQQDVTEIIIDEYGRTCRRYRLISRIFQSVTHGLAPFDCDWSYFEAARGESVGAGVGGDIAIFDNEYNLMEI